MQASVVIYTSWLTVTHLTQDPPRGSPDECCNHTCVKSCNKKGSQHAGVFGRLVNVCEIRISLAFKINILDHCNIQCRFWHTDWPEFSLQRASESCWLFCHQRLCDQGYKAWHANLDNYALQRMCDIPTALQYLTLKTQVDVFVWQCSKGLHWLMKCLLRLSLWCDPAILGSGSFKHYLQIFDKHTWDTCILITDHASKADSSVC